MPSLNSEEKKSQLCSLVLTDKCTEIHLSMSVIAAQEYYKTDACFETLFIKKTEFYKMNLLKYKASFS